MNGNGSGKADLLAGAGGRLAMLSHRVFGAAHDLKCTDIDVNADWLSRPRFPPTSMLTSPTFTAFRPDHLFHLGA